MQREDTDDYRSLFLNDIPMMDVRAPVEYAHGAFPHTVNIPILNNDERHKIGICYKEKGQEAAIELGFQLVTEQMKAERVAQWTEFARAHPEGYLYCFRGGLRSRKTQHFMAEADVHYPLIKGGYKAMRRFLLDNLESVIDSSRFALIAGRTGSGKTRVIHAIDNTVDLEGIAQHRGSSFGRTLVKQPCQIDFENQLSIALLKLHERKPATIYLEDESRLIGNCYVPDILQAKSKQANYVVVTEDLASRIAVVTDEYICQPAKMYQQHYDGNWFEAFSEDLLNSLDRIRKRLGGERHQQLRPMMQAALEQFGRSDDVVLFKEVIAKLLDWYYDPMYDFMLSKKQGRCLFSGTREEVIGWIQAQSDHT